LQDVRLRADIVAGSFLCISVGKLRGYRMVSRICNQESRQRQVGPVVSRQCDRIYPSNCLVRRMPTIQPQTFFHFVLVYLNIFWTQGGARFKVSRLRRSY